MSISVGPAIFCEGTPNSYDAKILNRLVPTGVTIVPTGSKHSMGAYVEAHFRNFIPEQRPPYLCFRDRDFDAEPPLQPALMEAGRKQSFLSYRTCIENYLLDPQLFAEYCKANHLPATLQQDTFRQWFLESAQMVRHYQAARWTLTELARTSKPPRWKSSWIVNDSKLPDDLSHQACLGQVLQLATDYLQRTKALKAADFTATFERYRTMFDQDSFYQQQQHLV